MKMAIIVEGVFLGQERERMKRNGVNEKHVKEDAVYEKDMRR